MPNNFYFCHHTSQREIAMDGTEWPESGICVCVCVCVCVRERERERHVSLLGVSINTVKNNTDYGPVNKIGVELNTDKTNWP
jgi:hypothetical protein